MKKEIFTYRKIVFLLTIINFFLLILVLGYLVFDFYFPFPHNSSILYDKGVFFYKVSILTTLFQYVYVSQKIADDQKRVFLYQKILDYVDD